MVAFSGQECPAPGRVGKENYGQFAYGEGPTDCERSCSYRR